MNWLRRAQLRFGENSSESTDVTAERVASAAMAVPAPATPETLLASFGCIGSGQSSSTPEHNDLLDAFEERAAIMEFDGGLSRDEAEREAWAIVLVEQGPRLPNRTSVGPGCEGPGHTPSSWPGESSNDFGKNGGK